MVAEAALTSLQKLLDEDSSGKLLRIFLLEDEPHLWQFTDFPAALAKVKKAMAFVQKRQEETMAIVRKALPGMS